MYAPPGLIFVRLDEELGPIYQQPDGTYITYDQWRANQASGIVTPDKPVEPQLPPDTPPVDTTSPEGIDEIHETVCDCDNQIQQLRDTVIAPIRQQIDEIRTTSSDISANIIGGINNLIDSVSATVERVGTKIINSVIDAVSNAFQQAGNCNIPYPTPELAGYLSETDNYDAFVRDIVNETLQIQAEITGGPGITQGTTTPEVDCQAEAKAIQNESEAINKLADVIKQQATVIESITEKPEQPASDTYDTFNTTNIYNDIFNTQQQPPADVNVNVDVDVSVPEQTEPTEPATPEIFQAPTKPNVPQSILDILRDPDSFSDIDKMKALMDALADSQNPSSPISFGNLFQMPDWGSETICQDLTARANLAANLTGNLSEAFGFKLSADGKERTWPQWAFKIAEPLPKLFKQALWSVLAGGIDGIGWIVSNLPNSPNCNVRAMVFPALAKAIFSWLNKLAGGAFNDLLTGLGYAINYTCPTEIPSAAEANSAYLNDAIDHETWQCWVKANNCHDNPQFKMVFGNRSKIGPLEALILYRFGSLTKDEYEKAQRANGFLYDSDRERFEEANVAFPGISDLIRMMVRDVGDANVVRDYKLDDGFQDKWKGLLAKYGDAQGVTEDIAKMYWMSHWDMPSNTQAYEMLHRLRPGRVPKEVETNVDDIRKLLEINDVLPFWRERLIAISYHPLTRTDAQRAFFINAITRDELKNTYMDEGYNDRDADILVRFTEQLKLTQEQAKPIRPRVRNALKAFSEGLYTEQQTRKIMDQYRMSNERKDELIATYDEVRRLRVMKAAIKCIKAPFMRFEINKPTARDRLINLGIDPANAADIANEWECNLNYKSKPIAASKLCKLAEQGLIDREDMIRRLAAMGYSIKDAEILSSSCKTDITKKQIDELTKQLKAQQRFQEQQIAAQKRAEREALREQERLARVKRQIELDAAKLASMQTQSNEEPTA